MNATRSKTILGELCIFQAGNAFPRSEQGLTSGKYPYIKVSDMSLPANSKRIISANNWVSEETANRMKLKLAPAGSVVFAKIGEGLKAERFRWTTRPTAMDNNMMAAVPISSAVDSRFLLYLLESLHLASWAAGSALPYLRQADLAAIKVEIPNRKSQIAIAETLGSLDDKIESNLRKIDLVWKLASATWKGLTTKAVEIPLGSMFQLVNGEPLPPTVRVQGDVPVYGSSGIVGWHNRALTTGPAVIIGRKGRIGSVYWESSSSFPSDTTFYVEPINGWPLIACYFAALDAGLLERNSNSAPPVLDLGHVLSAEVPLPELSEAKGWFGNVMPLIRMADAASREINSLTQLRDTMLPKMINGWLSTEKGRSY